MTEIEITMPSLSDSMQEGTILSWLVAEGDSIAPGDDLVEIETDKAAMTYQAEVAGRLARLAAEGESYPVGERIATVVPSGALMGEPARGEPTADGTGLATAKADVPAVAAASGERSNEDASNGSRTTEATPLARRIANLHGITLADLLGSGPRGRITKHDVLRAAGLAAEPSSTARPAAASRPGGEQRESGQAVSPTPVSYTPSGLGRLEDLSRRQLMVASRMAEAKATVPDFQVDVEVDMSAVVALRDELKLHAGDRPVASFNDMIVKAAALALREHPRVNSRFLGRQIEIMDAVNVGIAVAADDGLVVPVIHEADTKALAVIAAESRRLAGRVRGGEITPAELDGGTFTVSNLGMYGMSAISPIINIPQSAILGVGTMRPTLAREDDRIVDRPLVTLSLVGDHRVLNGAEAAMYLATVKRLLEAPLEFAL